MPVAELCRGKERKYASLAVTRVRFPVRRVNRPGTCGQSSGTIGQRLILLVLRYSLSFPCYAIHCRLARGKKLELKETI